MRDRAVGLLVLCLLGFLVLSAIAALFTLNRTGFYTNGEWVYRWDALWRGFPIYLCAGVVLGCLFSILLFYSFEEAYKQALRSRG
jgi:ABC-type uncharacterized transport system permease subunit